MCFWGVERRRGDQEERRVREGWEVLLKLVGSDDQGVTGNPKYAPDHNWIIHFIATKVDKQYQNSDSL